MPLVPTGTPCQNARSLVNPEKPSCPVSVSLYLTFRAAGSFRDPLAERMLNPEKPSCLVSLSLYLTFRAAGSFRDPLAERMLGPEKNTLLGIQKDRLKRVRI